jgi:hypothetical protein
MANTRSPERAAREAVFREIPTAIVELTLTGSGTVDTFDLAALAPGALGQWVWITPKGGSAFLRRYTGSAPSSASMQSGRAWPDGETEEVWLDERSAASLAAEGDTASMTVVIEYVES